MDKLVLLNKPIHPDALTVLREGASILAPYGASTEELLELLPAVHAIVLGVGLDLGPNELDMAANLLVIGRHGVGLDNVNLSAATERNIPVTYTPYGPTESTAEHTLLLMLATARRLSQLDRAVRASDFGIRGRHNAMGRELKGKVLGIVGFGRIGRRVADMCRSALHMTVRVHDPFISPEEIVEWGAAPVDDLCALAAQVDLLSVHTPLTADTRHIISETVIRAMKPGAILINTSRGPIVDEPALILALQEGHLGGAGLDVYDPQPPDPDNPLFRLDQVVLTPHVGSFTHEGRRLMGLTVVEDVLRALFGQRPKYLANPQVWSIRRR